MASPLSRRSEYWYEDAPAAPRRHRLGAGGDHHRDGRVVRLGLVVDGLRTQTELPTPKLRRGLRRGRVPLALRRAEDSDRRLTAPLPRAPPVARRLHLASLLLDPPILRRPQWGASGGAATHASRRGRFRHLTVRRSTVRHLTLPFQSRTPIADPSYIVLAPPSAAGSAPGAT